jgi:lipopolysaccharide transport system permease protein
MNRLSFLFVQWLKRDLAGRYRGSWLGMAWPLLQPMAQIAVFTLIFHGFMQVRWPTAQGAIFGTGSAWDYALNVLAGLAVFNFFSEVLGRSPGAVLSQPNLVTKVKFPLLLLPAVSVAAAMVHIAAGTLVLIGVGLLAGSLSWSVIGVMIWLIPVLLYGLGLAFLLSSLGVYVRDVGQIMPALTSLLMFLTPIFYPLSAVPDSLRSLFELNPVAWAAESLRGALLSGVPLELGDWSLHLGLSALLCLIGLASFQRLRHGFSDVL